MEGDNSKKEIKMDNPQTKNNNESILLKRNVNAGVFDPLASSEVSIPSTNKGTEFGASNDRKKNEEVYQNLKSHNSEKNLQNIPKNFDLSFEGNKKAAKKAKKKHLQKQSKVQKKDVAKNEIFLDDLSDEMFEIEHILRNPIYLKLIEDLVNCFTSNFTQSETELANLKLALFERTSSVFVKLLNECIDKTYRRVLNSDIIKELKKKCVTKHDASCQTCSSLTKNPEDKKNQMQ